MERRLSSYREKLTPARQGACMPLTNQITTKPGLFRLSAWVTLPGTVLQWLNFEEKKGPNDPFRNLPFFADLSTETRYPCIKNKGSLSFCRIHPIPTIPAFTASFFFITAGYCLNKARILVNSNCSNISNFKGKK